MSGRKRGRKRKYPVNYTVPNPLSSDDELSEPSEAREQRDSQEQVLLRDGDGQEPRDDSRHHDRQEAHGEHGVTSGAGVAHDVDRGEMEVHPEIRAEVDDDDDNDDEVPEEVAGVQEHAGIHQDQFGVGVDVEELALDAIAREIPPNIRVEENSEEERDEHQALGKKSRK